MRMSGMRGLLLASTGVALFLSGPALAQQQQDCTQELDRIEERLAQAELEQDRLSDIEQVVDGARTLGGAP